MVWKRKIGIFGAAVGFRIFMLFVAVAILAFQMKEGRVTLELLLNSFCRWDANHYIKIAQNGYRGAVEFCDVCREALLAKGVSQQILDGGQHLFIVFFPLFPWIMKLFGFLLVDVRIAGLLISILAFGAGCVYVYSLAEIDYGEETAQNSVVLLALFPFGFFFGGIMSESLFLMVSAATLYHIRKHQWWRVIFWGIFASLCRMQGALLILPAGLEMLVWYEPWKMIRTKDFSKLRELLTKCFSLLLMLGGSVIYMLINWVVEGHPFSFMVYQKSHWNNGLAWPTDTLTYVFQNAFSPNYNLQMRATLWIPQAVLAVFCVLLIIAGIKKIRPAYTGYVIGYILLTYSSAWLLSAGRYLSCCIPLFLVIAVLGQKRKWIVQISAVVFFALQMLFYQGYLGGLYIM